MIQVAFINNEGEITHWVQPGNDSMYGDNFFYDGYLAKHFAVDFDLKTYSKTNYWNFSSSEWVERDSKPGSYWKWESNMWIFYKPELLQDIRIQRNAKLYACDWTQVADSGLPEEKVLEWRAYRQELRDFIEVFAASGAIELSEAVWPTPPS